MWKDMCMSHTMFLVPCLFLLLLHRIVHKNTHQQ